MSPDGATCDLDLQQRLTQARQGLAGGRNRAAVLQAAREMGREICRSDGITLVLREGELCHYVEEDAISPLWKGQLFPIGTCISGWSMLNGQTAVIEDVFADPRIPWHAYRPTFVKSLIMTPVGARHLAALGAYWQTTRPFSAQDIQRVEAFAALVGEALEGLS